MSRCTKTPLTLLGICFVAGSVLASTPSKAATLDFNSFPGTTNFGSIAEDGFNVTGSGSGFHFLSTGGASFCSPSCPQNGTVYLFSMGDTFEITTQDASTFSFTSFDGAEGHEGKPAKWAQQIQAIGTRADATTIMQTFDLDFVQDGDGPLTDFQSFSAVGFTDLVSLSFVGLPSTGAGDRFSLDNIGLVGGAAPVPLPAALPLLLGALGALGILGWRRKRAAKGCSS